MTTVTSRIEFVGVDDDNLGFFENQYPVISGISYNSYLVKGDDALAVVDAVDVRRRDEWLLGLECALDGAAPSYLIVQHMEPDHSGSILALAGRYPEMKIVATSKAIEMLGNFFPGTSFDGHTMAVANGDTLDLGSLTLTFLTAPMVHWPEVMVTHCSGSLDRNRPSLKGVLFSADAFGSFALSGDADGAWPGEARRYYANIVGKYGVSVQGMLRKVKDLKVDIIAPLHGPVLTEDAGYYMSLYDRWSRYQPETDGVFIPYASVYGATADAARSLAAMLRSKGAGEVTVMDLCRHDVSYAVAEAFRLSRMVLCSVTYDGDLFPPMYNFLHHLSLKGLRGRRVGIIENGSWAPRAAAVMTDMLGGMLGMTIAGPAVTLRSRMTEANLSELETLADAILQ